MKRHALFIGVDQYADENIQDLRCAVNDATELAGFFKHRARFDRAEALPNPRNCEAILDRVYDMISGLGVGDEFLFFFAGHGIRTQDGHRLVCAGDKLNAVKHSWAGLPLERIKSETSGAFDRLFLLDACRTDVLATNRGVAGAMEKGTRDLIMEAATSADEYVGALTILCSCNDGECAGEILMHRHGLFSMAMLELLDEECRCGRRVLVTDDFVYNQIPARMRALAETSGMAFNQNPQKEGPPILLLDGQMEDRVMPVSVSSLTTPVVDAASTVSDLVVCPICGKHNVITNTFRCTRCGKDHLCTEHFSAAENCCVTCSRQEVEVVNGKAQDNFDKGERYFYGRGVRKSYVRAVEYYKEAADMEHSDAQQRLGECYYSGHGVSKDYGAAIKWFRKAAEHGSVRAQYMLGEMYGSGKGISRNYKESAKWYKMASEKGDKPALLKLGLCYAEGLGLSQNSWIAYKCIRKAFESGEKDARDHLKRLESQADVQYAIGEMYAKGVDVKKDLSQATLWFRRAARNGHSEAKVALGVMLLDRTGDNKNIEDAEKLLRKAAAEGNVVARKGMGDVYRKYGEISAHEAHDESDANKWYKKAISMYMDAAKIDDAEAQRALSYLYWKTGNRKEAFHWCSLLLSRFGEDGVDPEIQLILGQFSAGEDQLKWFRKAAERGNLLAQSYLGEYYCKGEDANLETALTWFSKAASQGCAEAQYKLGNCHKQGIGTAQDFVAALRWYEKAAEQGYVEAEAAFGEMLYKGIGCNRDIDEAKKWLRKAAKEGDFRAQKILGDLYVEAESECEATKWYRKAITSYLVLANRGNADAQKSLGYLYARIGDAKESAKWYREVVRRDGEASINDALGQYFLGWHSDSAEQARWWRLAAESGRLNAQYEYDLGYAFYYGTSGHGEINLRKDVKEAAKWFNLAASKGHKEAQDFLIRMIINGDDFEYSQDMIAWCNTKLQTYFVNDFLRCCLAIGIMYARGLGGVPNGIEAEKWFSKALCATGIDENRDWEILVCIYCELAELKANGNLDIDKILNLCEKAIRLTKHRNAIKVDIRIWRLCLKIINIYYLGDGKPRDIDKAFRYFRKFISDLSCVYGLSFLSWLAMLGIVERTSSEFSQISRVAQTEATAQWRLGWLYMNGLGAEKNEAESIKWYRRSVERMSAEGQYFLGWSHILGRGADKNIVGGLVYISQAKQQGEEKASAVYEYLKDEIENKVFETSPLNEIALVEYRKGADALSCEKYEQAFCHYLISAEIGNSDACYALYSMYRDGVGVKRDILNIVDASMWLHKAGLQGSMVAWKTLANLYDSGTDIIIENKYIANEIWRLRLAGKGDVSEQMNLAAYYWGTGSDEEVHMFASDRLVNALKWYDAAAAQGSDLAKETILRSINVLIKNTGVSSLRSEVCLKWAKTAAELGNVQTMEYLAEYYCSSVDKSEMFKWWLRAIELRRGDEHFTTAMDWLFYDRGHWINMRNYAAARQDEFEAVVKLIAKRCQQFAEEGNGFAQIRLSKCFEYGYGVKRNYRKAILWCRNAAEKKVPGAEKRLSVLQENYAKLSFLDKMFG